MFSNVTGVLGTVLRSSAIIEMWRLLVLVLSNMVSGTWIGNSQIASSDKNVYNYLEN